MGKIIRIGVSLLVLTNAIQLQSFRLKNDCKPDLDIDFDFSTWGRDLVGDAKITRDGTNFSSVIRGTPRFTLKAGETIDLAEKYSKEQPGIGARSIFPLNENRYPFRMNIRRAGQPLGEKRGFLFTAIEAEHNLPLDAANSPDTVVKITCPDPNDIQTWKLIIEKGKPEAKQKAAATATTKEWSKELAQSWVSIKQLLDKYADKQPKKGQSWWDENIGIWTVADYNRLGQLRDEAVKLNPDFDDFLNAFLQEYGALPHAIERRNLAAALDYVLPFLFGTAPITIDEDAKTMEIIEAIGADRPTGKIVAEILKKRHAKYLGRKRGAGKR